MSSVANEMYRELDAYVENQGNEQRKNITAQIVYQIKAFINLEIKRPYCVLEHVIVPYYQISGKSEDLIELLKAIDKKFKVLFLSSTQGAEVKVEKVAVLNPSYAISSADSYWQKEYKGNGSAKVLALKEYPQIISQFGNAKL